MPQFTTRRQVRHAADDMFHLVADVERYPEFVPLCKALKVRQRNASGEGVEIVIADMTVSQPGHAGQAKSANPGRIPARPV